MDRRRAARRIPAAGEPLARVRLRTGRELTVVDVSNAGALVEGARLLPGTHVDAHVVTRDGRVLVRSRIVRSYVTELRADVVSYRSALAFDRAVDTSAAGYAIPVPFAAIVDAPSNGYPVPIVASPRENDERLSA